MKTEELKEQGLTDEQIKFVMKENGLDIGKAKKERDDLAADRDKWKAQAESAEATLKGFDGVDVEKMKSDIESYKKAAEDAQKDYEAKLKQRDVDDALRVALDGVEFTSAAAKKSIEAEIRNAGLTLKDGKLLGLTDLMDTLKASDASAFVDQKQKKLEAEKPKFTGSMKDSGTGSTVTRESIMAIKDATERQKAIAENIGLFR